MNALPSILAASVLLALAAPRAAYAQDAAQACTPEHAAMGHCTLPASTPTADPACPPEHAAMGHCTPKTATPMPATPMPAMACTPEHAAMGHCTLPAPTPPADPACPPEHAAMGHCTPKTAAPMPAMACTPEHAAMGHCTLPASTPPADPACPPEHAAMGHCTPRAAAPTEPREPIPPLSDADRAAAFPELASMHDAHGGGVNSLMLFDRLEGWEADPGHGQRWEGSAWIGGDIDRLWLRSEGERSDGRLESADVEALYGHSLTAWWDLMAGVRQDFKPGPTRQWAAIGIQGLAPYKFEVSATAYLGPAGRTAAKVEVEYELLLTNRLILQPQVEVNAYGRDDPQRHLGSGLGNVEAGLRLRYEISRRFAPYIGVVHERSFGQTADYRRQDGESTRDTRVVAGVRVWF